MRFLVAVNNMTLEKFISELRDVEVIDNLKDKEALLKSIKANKPEVIIISHLLPGKNKMENIIYSIVTSGDFQGRIIYLYGPNDGRRKAYTNFLIKNGIYDFHYGDLDGDSLNELIFHPKNEEDVKFENVEEEIEAELIDDSEDVYASREEAPPEEHQPEENVIEEKEVVPKVNIEPHTHIEEKPELKPKVEPKLEPKPEPETKVEIRFVEKIVEVEKEVIKPVYIEKTATEEEKRKKEVIIEKPVVIQKDIYKRETVEVINSGTIAIISPCSTGKSFINWNLAHCFSDRGYNTSAINLDRGYSANIYFDIDETEPSALSFLNYTDKKGIGFRKKETLTEHEIQSNLNKCLNMTMENSYQFSRNIDVFTNPLCSKEEITESQFINLLNVVQAKSEITLIDCSSGFNNIVKTAITYSNTVLFVVDLDYMHWQLSLEFLEQIKNYLNPQKTLIVINNVFKGSKEINNMYSYIKDLDFSFRDIVMIKNCGAVAYELMKTDSCPYFYDEDFKNDIDVLMDKLSAREKKEKMVKSFFKRRK